VRLSKTQLSLIFAGLCALAVVPGCDRRTPDERLATALQFSQQGDAASAEMEALKVIEKAPNDPVAVQASVLLAQIYASQNRMEEAQMQLESALKNVSQLDPIGKEILRQYLATLNAQKKYDESLKTIEKFQKEYAEDPGTSLSLQVAKADVQTISGNTTGAREVLTDIMAATTGPAEMMLYRDLYAKTFLRDENTTAAANYLREQLQNVQRPQDKITILTNLAQLSAATENYEQSREYLGQLTGPVMDELKKETDLLNRVARGLQLGQIYLSTENLPGARRVFQSLYDTGIEHPDAVQAVVNSLMETELRMGDTSATEQLLTDAAKKHPKGPFADVLKRMQEVIAKGQLQQLAPVDTSTLALKYKADPNVLWPEQLPAALAEVAGTSGTLTAAGETSGTMPQAGMTTGAAQDSGTPDAAPAANVTQTSPTASTVETSPSASEAATSPTTASLSM
jgi:tetratricopeptide (TPR) repeat protein